MQDGRTHPARKTEYGVDLETGAILAMAVQDASEGDAAAVEAVRSEGRVAEEVAPTRAAPATKRRRRSPRWECAVP